MPTQPDKLSQPQFAALVGVTPRRIRQLAKDDETFPQCIDGYDPAEVGKWLQRRALEEAGALDEEAPDYHAERARLTKAQADIAEVNLRKLEGELIEKDQVTRFLVDVANAVKAKVRTIPTKLGPMVQGLDVTETVATLRKGVDEALRELSRQFRPNS